MEGRTEIERNVVEQEMTQGMVFVAGVTAGTFFKTSLLIRIEQVLRNWFLDIVNAGFDKTNAAPEILFPNPSVASRGTLVGSGGNIPPTGAVSDAKDRIEGRRAMTRRTQIWWRTAPSRG